MGEETGAPGELPDFHTCFTVLRKGRQEKYATFFQYINFDPRALVLMGYGSPSDTEIS